MKALYTLVTGLLLLFTTSTSFAQSIFAEFTSNGNGALSIAGEIPITSAQYSLTQTLNISSQSTGTGAGKVGFNPLVITKLVDAASASLQTSTFTGGSYSRIRINFYRTDASGSRVLVYRVSLGTASVSYYAVSAAEGCSSGCPGLNETVSIEYGQVTYADYTQTPAKVVGWDRVRNVTISQEL